MVKMRRRLVDEAQRPALTYEPDSEEMLDFELTEIGLPRPLSIEMTSEHERTHAERAASAKEQLRMLPDREREGEMLTPSADELLFRADPDVLDAKSYLVVPWMLENVKSIIVTSVANLILEMQLTTTLTRVCQMLRMLLCVLVMRRYVLLVSCLVQKRHLKNSDFHEQGVDKVLDDMI